MKRSDDLYSKSFIDRIKVFISNKNLYKTNSKEGVTLSRQKNKSNKYYFERIKDGGIWLT
tara:strand:+ start:5055 stop:5234 length:180 start_codon:yes stop_codon:yes gene_type:complete